jgi:hypothetical protein
MPGKKSGLLFIYKSILVEMVNINMFLYTVDSRYLEFDGTMDKIRVNRSSTQEELRYLEVISRFTKFKEFNGEKKNSNKNIEYV